MKKSICLLIKNENKYLEEWINWHIDQGFNYFYIYNTGSENPSLIVNKFNKNLFTIIEWNKYSFNMQLEAYQHCLNTNKNDDWIAFIDIDEFIYLPDKQYLDKVDSDISIIKLKQKLFNANGNLYYNNNLVQNLFKQECDNIEKFKPYKSIIRPKLIQLMGVHFPIKYIGKILYNDNLFYHHYYTKSLEEWEEKISRGSCDPRVRKKYSSFFLYNPNLIKYKKFQEYIQSYNSKN